jgi:hypothetical protein
MRRFALALLAWAALAAPALAQAPPAYCDSTYVISISGAVSVTQIVAPVAGKRIYICGYALHAGAATSAFQLTTGTGVNCNVGQQALTPVWSLPPDGSFVNRSPTVGESSAVGAALCYNIVGAGPLSAVIYYDQF